MSNRLTKTDEEWRKSLTPEQHRVLRKKGTEPPFSGMYSRHKEVGVYTCSACGNEMFSSNTKYDSGSGWPSFWSAIEKDRIKTQTDNTPFMTRTEILCGRCGGHLGHVFEDGPEPTGLRYCVNSISLDFHKLTESERNE
ncbi:MAG: peptide-methionine (R)-S-oxide reductase MsrB [Fidelibacterota bacterium]